jgi:adenosylcobinamide-GDP ribazoletransferase
VSLLAALQFLTRVPIRLRRAPSPATAVPWFPVAGALIGAAVGGVAAGMWEISSPAVAGTLAVIVGMLVTGAFHEDGLADVADAIAGGATRERRLEILKDPRHGTYGVAALCASVLVRAAAIGSLPGPWAMFTAAVAAHTLARAAAVAAMGSGRIVNPGGHDGLGADYARATTPGRAALGVLAGLAISTAACGWWTLPLAATATLSAAAVAWWAGRALGGISGDVLGAIEQVAECGCLVVATVLATRG